MQGVTLRMCNTYKPGLRMCLFDRILPLNGVCVEKANEA